jgi:hypothetical protein
MVQLRPDQSGRRIQINSQFFTLAADQDVVVYPVNSESQAIRTIGIQLRQNNRKLNKAILEHNLGLFWARQRRESGRGVGGVRDADAETRFDTITLPLNPQTVSANLYSGANEHFQSGYSAFDGGLWAGIHVHNTGSASGQVGFVKYGASSDNWTAGIVNIPNDLFSVTPATGDSARVIAQEVFGGQVFLLLGIDDDSANTERYFLCKSVDGETFTDARGSPDAPFTTDIVTTAVLAGNDWRVQLGALVNTGNKLVVAVRELAASADGSVDQFVFYSSATATGTPSWDADTTIPSSVSQIKMHLWIDHLTSGFPAIPIAVLNEGIYQIDTTNEIFNTIFSFTGQTGDGLASAVAVANNNLYVGLGDGDILEISAIGVGALQYRNIGPQSTGDGPVTARQGYATYILGTSPRWLFVAYGGNAANKNASIFAYEYTTRSWHSVYLDTTANREITQMWLSGVDDSVMRLHFNTEGATDDVAQMIEEPLVSVSVGATQQYRASGYVEYAEDDLGDPHTSSAIMTGRVDVDGLDNVSTVEAGDGTDSVHIEHEYGTDDGTSWTATSNLGIYASDDKVLFFGKTNQNIPSQTEAGTPVGASAKLIRHRLSFYRDSTNTKTPKLKEFQVEHVNKQAHLKGFTIAIDIGATALDQNIDPEVVDDRIDTIIESVTSVPLAFGEETDGTGTTYYVESVPTGRWESEGVLPNAPGIGTTTERTKHVGIRTLTLEERIDV